MLCCQLAQLLQLSFCLLQFLECLQSSPECGQNFSLLCHMQHGRINMEGREVILQALV